MSPVVPVIYTFLVSQFKLTFVSGGTWMDTVASGIHACYEVIIGQDTENRLPEEDRHCNADLVCPVCG